MARADNGDNVPWKDIAGGVHNDADKLFKIIGEAYAVLSDPIKVIAMFLSSLLANWKWFSVTFFGRGFFLNSCIEISYHQ